MEFLALVVAGIAGIVLHVLTKLYDLVTLEPKVGNITFVERSKNVWLKFDLLKSLVYAAMGLVVIFLLAGFKEQVSYVFPVTLSTVLMAGYSVDSFLNNLKREK